MRVCVCQSVLVTSVCVCMCDELILCSLSVCVCVRNEYMCVCDFTFDLLQSWAVTSLVCVCVCVCVTSLDFVYCVCLSEYSSLFCWQNKYIFANFLCAFYSLRPSRLK